MALFHPRNAEGAPAVPVPPLVAPHLTVDGWELAGTPLDGRIPRDMTSELTALLHCVSMRVDTPWTYERAAQLLEECGERGQALAVCEAWFELGASQWPEHAAKTRALARRRNRLRTVLASRGA